MHGHDHAFVPGLGLHSLTGAYDTVVAHLMPEQELKSRLLDIAGVKPGDAVLDLGCGTGTLAVMAAQRGARVTGVDADSRMLAQAAPKVDGLDVRLIEGSTTTVELEEASFDIVISSLFFHHLADADKRLTLERTVRWLKPGGRLVIADFARPRHLVHRALFTPARLMRGLALTHDVLDERVPALMAELGFQEVTEVDTITTLPGTVAWWSAVNASPLAGA